MSASHPRIKLPDTIKAGDIVEVKTVVRHTMETGNRRDKNGQPIPRDIITSLVATFDGNEVFRAEFGPGISANPYLSFEMRVPGPGVVEVTWTDTYGATTVARAPLTIS